MHPVIQSTLRHLLPPALALAASCALAAPTYDVRAIAPPEKTGDVYIFWYDAIDLNNDGTTLTRLHQYKNPYSGYKMFDKHGNVVDMPPWTETPPNESTDFVGLNNWGDIIGSMTHEGSIWKGIVKKVQGYSAEVHGLPDDIYGGFFSDAYAYDANDVGQVVGKATSSTDGRWRAYVWKDKVMVEIGTFGGPASSASAINRHGVVVGSADLADGSTHAFAFRKGRLHDLGTLGGANSSATNINNVGQIIGNAQQADGMQRAFVYSDELMKPLPTPEGASANASSINRDGFVVGSYRLDGQSYPFLYDGVAVHRLNDLIDQSDQTAKRPWKIESVSAINDRGLILCDGRKEGDEHATVLLLKPRP